MMNSSKKVSVIMGVYNCADTLSVAIESIIAQTYTNWQFIICDDGSTDDTLSVALKYENEDPERFLVIKNEKNIGLNATLNKCLEIAEGAYIARMDGDDVSHPERFEKEVSFLDSNPDFALVSCFMSTFDEKGDWGCITTKEYPQVNDFPTTVPMFCHAPCMIRREAFVDVGGYTEDKRLLRVEDYHLWYKIYAKGYKGYNIQEALYKMRDDRNALHRRTASARMNGIYATFVGFKMVKMPVWKYIYAIKNAAVEMIKIVIPDRLYSKIHKSRLKTNERER